ncbi:MAG: hypothetical protein HUU43_17035 [Ignavibacteriaceae bacterium]|nr:hypothetical protein [Ignavibacteriaceae bacterium]
MNQQNKKKYPFYFYPVTILLPFFILFLLELSLRIFNYAPDPPQWISPAPGNENWLYLNPDYIKTYFGDIGNVPTSINDAFLKEKPANGFRIFVLGESSAAGFPYEPNGSFSRFLAQKLGYAVADKKIEVINVGISAVSSYVIYDMIDGIIEQKPDLVLVYTGHNEYYGVLGVASNRSFSKNPLFVKAMLKLRHLKTVKLISGLFAGGEAPTAPAGGGLMEQLSSESLISYGSDDFKAGIQQFENNLGAISRKLSNAGVPVILSTIVSNLKDQPPFESEKGQYDAAGIFSEAQASLNAGDSVKALRLYKQARDYDILRFRAPEEINGVIKKVAAEFNFPLIDPEKAFSAQSPSGIIGDELMTDHLHPVLHGYKIISGLFFDEIFKNKYLSAAAGFSPEKAESVLAKDFLFTALDSTIARLRIATIKKEYPFNRKGEQKTISDFFTPKVYADTLAMEVASGARTWATAHIALAERYFLSGDIAGLTREYEVVIAQYPFHKGFYNDLCFRLMKLQDYDLAYKYLEKSYLNGPDDFSTKWLGIIDLSRGEYSKALKYLKESVSYNGSDAQVWYNLSGAYLNHRMLSEAKGAILECLRLEPGFPGARELKIQLDGVQQ